MMVVAEPHMLDKTLEGILPCFLHCDALALLFSTGYIQSTKAPIAPCDHVY